MAAATRSARRSSCARHGLSADAFGRCVLCRRPERSSTRRIAPGIALVALLMGTTLWWLRQPPPTSRAVARAEVGAKSARARLRAPRAPTSSTWNAAEERDGLQTPGSSGAEEPDVDMNQSDDVVPEEDRHLDEGGPIPSSPVPRRRAPDPPAPPAPDPADPPPPDNPHDFDLPPAGQATAPWHPPL